MSGGGIPVAEANGELTGVDAVIDKDLASSLLAVEIKADVLMFLTTVTGYTELQYAAAGRAGEDERG